MAPKTVRVVEVKWEVGIKIRGGLGTVHPEIYSILYLVKDKKYTLFSVCNTKFRKFSSPKSWMNMTSERFSYGELGLDLCVYFMGPRGK